MKVEWEGVKELGKGTVLGMLWHLKKAAQKKNNNKERKELQII